MQAWQSNIPWAWIVGDGLASVSVAFVLRHLNWPFDINTILRNIHICHLPELISLHWQSDGGFYDWGVMRCDQTILEAWAFAFTYGVITVRLCNELVVNHLDDHIGWLVTLWAVFFSMMWMCSFATNAIHVVTTHYIHFFYYGCGFVSLVFYSRVPSAKVLVFVVLARLSFNTVLKYIAWPNYPFIHNIVPMYKYDASNGELECLHIPKHISALVDIERPMCFQFKGNGNVRDKLSTLQYYFPMPIYEVLNGHVASHFCYGMIIGCAWAHGHSLELSEYVCFMGAICTAGLLGVVLCLFQPCWYSAKFDVLHRFAPRRTTVVLLIVGAAIGVLELWPRNHSQRHGLLVWVACHGFHFVQAGLFVLHYAAAAKHLGCGVYKRLVGQNSRTSHSQEPFLSCVGCAVHHVKPFIVEY